VSRHRVVDAALPSRRCCVAGSSKRREAGSATTAPRPTVAPRHEVRGERRGRSGAARLRRREGWGRHRRGDRGGGSRRIWRDGWGRRQLTGRMGEEATRRDREGDAAVGQREAVRIRVGGAGGGARFI
jgi:hypothetical protein